MSLSWCKSRSITPYLTLSFLFFLVDREQQITIKAMSGEIIVLKVKPRDSVKEMKIKISEMQGFPPSQQRLIFRWKKLEDHCTLSDYGVNENRPFTLLCIWLLDFGCRKSHPWPFPCKQ